MVDVLLGQPWLGDHRGHGPGRSVAACAGHEAPQPPADAVLGRSAAPAGRVVPVVDHHGGRTGPGGRPSAARRSGGWPAVGPALARRGMHRRVGDRVVDRCDIGRPVRPRRGAGADRRARVRRLERVVQLLSATDRRAGRARCVIQSWVRLRIPGRRAAAGAQPDPAARPRQHRSGQVCGRTDLLHLRRPVVGGLRAVVAAPLSHRARAAVRSIRVGRGEIPVWPRPCGCSAGCRTPGAT